MENYNKLLEFVQSLQADFGKFYEKEQSAAGTRLRKGLSELKKMAQDIRNDVQDVKNSRKDSSKPE